MLLILNGNPFTSRQRKLKKFLVRDKIRLFNERDLWSLENFMSDVDIRICVTPRNQISDPVKRNSSRNIAHEMSFAK